MVSRASGIQLILLFLLFSCSVFSVRNPTPMGDTENSSETLHKLRLTKTQLEALHKLLRTPTASGSLAIQGTALNTTHEPITTSWILDSVHPTT